MIKKSLIFIISKRDTVKKNLSKYSNIFTKNKLVLMAEGSARSSSLKILGLEKTSKEIGLIVVDEKDEEKTLNFFDKTLNLSGKNTGIAFSVPMKSLGLDSSSFWQGVGLSSLRILSGLSLSIFLAIILSILSHKNCLIREINDLISDLLKSTPITLIIIILLILFSNKYISIIAAFIGTFPIFYTNFLQGLDSADQKLLDMAKIFEFSELNKYKYICIASAREHLLSAVKISTGVGWKAGIAAEIIGSPPNTIGNSLQSAKIFLATDDIFAYAIVIILLSRLSLLIFYRLVVHLYQSFTGDKYDKNKKSI